MAIERILSRSSTAAQWTAANPVLLDREMGHERDTGRHKIGDGVTAWTSLTYQTDSTRGWHQFVDVRDFGVSDAGGTDDTTGLQAAINSLANAPGTVYLPRRALTGGFGIYWTSAPIILKAGQNIVADGIGVVAVKALPSFTGTAMFLTNTWTAGGDPNSYWHWGSIENMRIDCASVAPIAVAIHAMGECAVLRRLLILNATDSGIVLTGAHAPATIEHVSVSNSTNYGIKLTSHPTYSGNSGAVRMTGVSGDNNLAAHLYTDGAHAISIDGWKSESHFVGLQIQGTSTPSVTASGYFNTGRASADLYRVAGTAAPRITSVVRTNGVTNLVNDTVTGKTVPTATIGTVLPALTYGGKNYLAGPVVRGRATQTRTGNGTVTVDASVSDLHDVTLAGNATSCTITNPTVGQTLTLTFIQDATGSRTYTWPTATYAASTAPPNLAAPAARDTVTLTYDGASWNEQNRSQAVQVTDLRGTNTKVAVYYVDPSKGNDTYDGLSWRRPKATIQACINAANTAAQAATIVVSNDRHDVGSGLVITKGQPVTITAEHPRPLKYASPAVYSTVQAGCGPTLYSSTGASPLVSWTGNGNAYGGTIQSVCFEMTGAAQPNAIVAFGVNAVTVDDCFFFFGTSTPAATAVAIWAYNLANPSAGGDDSSWWRITNNWVGKGGLVKFGSSTSDTTAVAADANQNVIRDNMCTGRRVDPGDVVAPAIEINRGHRTSIRDNNVECYTVGILLRGCFQCAESADGGEQVEKFLRLVNTRSTDLAPMGSSNAGNIPNSCLVALESTSVSNVIRTPATTTVDTLYATTTGAVTTDSTSPLTAQTVITTDPISKPAYRVSPKSAVRSNQWGYAPESGPFTTAVLANGVQKYSPLGIDRAATIIEIGVEVTTAGSAGSVIRFGVYADDGAGFPTGLPLLDAGTADATSTGFKSVASLSLPRPRGLYHLSVTGQGAPTTPPQLRCIGGVAAGVVPLAGPLGGTNCTGYQDSATVTGALGAASPNSNATGPLIAVRYQ